METLFQISLIVNNGELSDTAKIEQITVVLDEAEVSSGVIARLIRSYPKLEGVNPAITDKHFPTEVEPSLEGARLETYDQYVSTDFILADLQAKGRRAATAAETLLYGMKNSEEPKKGSFLVVVGLGQVWKSPNRDLSFCVVIVRPGYGQTLLDLVVAVRNEWPPGTRFLSLPL